MSLPCVLADLPAPWQMPGMNDFTHDWAQYFPSIPPLGWMLRVDTPNWVRFHSLPESKRYAETDAENAIVLERANLLASDVLGEGRACWFVQAVYSANDGTELVATVENLAPNLDLKLVFSLPVPEDQENGDRWNFYVAGTVWRRGAFDTVIASVAEDAAPPTLWMSRSSGEVFAPYDGGSDLILSSVVRVEELRTRYAGWLSSHPQGL
jgi:hypothetical protein